MLPDRDKLLDTINSIYAELDEFFYRMEANNYSESVCRVYIQHLEDVKNTLHMLNQTKVVHNTHVVKYIK